MNRRLNQPSPEAQDTLRALRRAAKNALELGLKTGTPVWVVQGNQLVDLTKKHRTSKKSAKTNSRKADRVKTSR
jgi:hypothetical protein